MKENQAVRSEASYLIFRPASVATACEAHEALIFWLLLDQAKSNGKEIHRFALNDKLMVNCYAGYTVSECRGTSPLPPFKGGKSEAKRGDVIPSKEEFAGLTADRCNSPERAR